MGTSVEATDAFMASTDGPVDATDAFKASTDAPIDATDASVSQMRPPMPSTDAFMASTDGPFDDIHTRMLLMETPIDDIRAPTLRTRVVVHIVLRVAVAEPGRLPMTSQIMAASETINTHGVRVLSGWRPTLTLLATRPCRPTLRG
jgi:hypothetical protein